MRACIVAQSCLTLCDPMTVACQAPLSMGFSRQEYWSGLPCPPPGDLPDSGIEAGSPALQVNSLPLSHQGSPENKQEKLITFKFRARIIVKRIYEDT